MATLSETAYPRLPSTIAPSDLRTLFSITPRERRWLSSLRVEPTTRRDTALYPKCFQSLGHFPRASAIPAAVVEFVSSALRLPSLPYVPPNQRASHRIKNTVRRFCRVKLFSPAGEVANIPDYVVHGIVVNVGRTSPWHIVLPSVVTSQRPITSAVSGR